MSAVSAEPAPGARSAGAGVIVGVALALMLGSALVAFLIMSRGGPIDGAALLQETFGVRTIGDGFVIVDAREVPSGTRIVVLEDSLAPPEPAVTVPAQSSGAARIDWKRVVIPPAASRPRRVLFTFPKESGGAAVVDAFFETPEWKDVDDLGSQGGKVVITSEKIAWHGFDARWVHERAFEPGGSFRDAVRANVSLEKRPCVMTATWTRGQAASKETLQQILGALRGG